MSCKEVSVVTDKRCNWQYRVKYPTSEGFDKLKLGLLTEALCAYGADCTDSSFVSFFENVVIPLVNEDGCYEMLRTIRAAS